MLYLDNAATTLKKPLCVCRAMIYNTLNNSVNAGHGGHFYSIRGMKGIYESAEKIAELINVKNPERIAFTQNATYALNMAIRGAVEKNDHIVTTCMDHNSVLRTAADLGNFTMVGADKTGYVTPENIERAIKPETKLIVMTHISNVSGTVEPVEAVGKIAKKHGILFMVDAAQSVGVKDIDAEKLGADMLAFSAHKGLMGPLGVGVLYVSENVDLKPVITGGTGVDSKNLIQPRTFPDMIHSGTMNTPAIMSCAAAADYLKKRGAENIGERESELAMRFIENIKNMDNIKVYGKTEKKGRSGIVSFNVGNISSTEIAEILNDEYKICTRGGWHCAYPAHCAIGSGESGAVRVSFGAFDDGYALDRITEAVYEISKRYKNKP